MTSIRKIREKVESVVYRLQMYFYLLLTVVLPIAFIVLVGVATAGVLNYRDTPPAALGWLVLPPWLDGWIAGTVGSMDPVSRMVLVGLAVLAGIVVLVTISMNIE